MGAASPHPKQKNMKKTIITILIIVIIIVGYYYFNSDKKIEDVVQANTQEEIAQFNENSWIETEEEVLSEIDNLENEENKIDAMISELEELSF